MNNCSHEIFTSEAMSDLVALACQVTPAAAHAHVFIDNAASRPVYEPGSMQEEIPNFGADSEVAGTMRWAIFEVKSVPLHYT